MDIPLHHNTHTYTLEKSFGLSVCIKNSILRSVHFVINRPMDIHGEPLSGTKFRQGDRLYSIETREIVDILYYPSEPFFRYKLKDMPNVSYSAYDLKLSEHQDNYYAVREIIGMKTVKKEKFFLVWWKKQLKKNSTWESEKQLIEDGFEKELQEFETKQNTKKGIVPKKVVEPVKDYDEEEYPYWEPLA